jgi:predicted nucleic acid-binding protein
LSQYFLDASALVKRYMAEPGSAWVLSITEPVAQQAILLAEVTLVEAAAALAAKQRAPQGISVETRDRALSRFLQDCDEHFLVVQMDRSMIDRAVDLTQRHRLRGYDAVQLAAALAANQELVDQRQSPLIFVASDHDLIAAAQAEGLATDNPLHYADQDPTP